MKDIKDIVIKFDEFDDVEKFDVVENLYKIFNRLSNGKYIIKIPIVDDIKFYRRLYSNIDDYGILVRFYSINNSQIRNILGKEEFFYLMIVRKDDINSYGWDYINSTYIKRNGYELIS